ncbi:MAG: type II secretion system protein [Gemmataceae bacterium]
MRVHRPRPSRRTGLTLSELVVVLVILAATAALVIPRLGFMKDQSNMATGAAGAADVMSNLEQFKLTTGNYPQLMDSLIETGGTNVLSTLWFHPGASASDWITVEDLAPGYLASLRHGFGRYPDSSGQFTVVDHDPSITPPGNSATQTLIRPVTGSSSSLAVVNTATSRGQAIAQAAGYPTGVPPANVRLVALGVGPMCEAVGRTMASAPLYSGVDHNVYNRFIAIFAVYNSNDRGYPAELRAVIDSKYGDVGKNINQYRTIGRSRD